MKPPASAAASFAAVRPEVRAYAGLWGAALAWSVAFVVGKSVLSSMTPLAVAFFRYFAAGLVLAPLALRDPSIGRLARVAAPLAVMTVLGGILYPWAFLASLARTTATNSSLLIALNPAFTAVLAPLVGERLSRRGALGVAVALVGAALVITRGDLAILWGLELNTGDLLAMLAAAAWAVFNLAARRVVGVLSPTVTNCVVFLASSAALFALGRGEDPLAQLAGAPSAVWLGLAVLAIVPSVIGGQLFLEGVRVVGVSRSAVFVYLVPVITAALAALTLGEALGPAQMVGGGAVLLGVALASRSG